MEIIELRPAVEEISAVDALAEGDHASRSAAIRRALAGAARRYTAAPALTGVLR
jgi:predicted transcriptional regulator